MSKSKEQVELTGSEATPLLPKNSAEVLELVQRLQTQLTETISSLQKLVKDPSLSTDLINQLILIPTDSLKLYYSLRVESQEETIIDFSNTTVIHQATGANPVNTVNRVNTILSAELLEPAVLVLQNYISKISTRLDIQENDVNDLSSQW